MVPSCLANSAKLESAQAELGRQWQTQNQGQPNLGLRGDALTLYQVGRPLVPKIL